MTQEINHEEWKEIRNRVDSLANSAFLIAGGALSLSINVMLGNKKNSNYSEQVICYATEAWDYLLISIVLFMVMKILMIAQAFTLQFNPKIIDNHILKVNGVSWSVGLSAFALFVYGLYQMVRAASLAIGA